MNTDLTGIPETLVKNLKGLNAETLKIESRIMSESLRPDEIVKLLERQQKLQEAMSWLGHIAKKIQANNKIITQPGNGKLITLDS